MRVTMTVLLATACAGATPEPPAACDEAACTTWCEANAPRVVVTAPDPAVLESRHLSQMELSLFHDELFGHRTSDLWKLETLTLCEGESACLTPRKDLAGRPLPPGAYVIRADLRVPTSGSRTLIYRRSCTPTDGTGQAQVVHEAPIELASSPDQPVSIQLFEGVVAPSEVGLRCTAQLLEGGEAVDTLQFGIPRG